MFCHEVFGDTVLEYTKSTTRITGHLTGYDLAKAPTFVWPERLLQAKTLIRERAMGIEFNNIRRHGRLPSGKENASK